MDDQMKTAEREMDILRKCVSELDVENTRLAAEVADLTAERDALRGENARLTVVQAKMEYWMNEAQRERDALRAAVMTALELIPVPDHIGGQDLARHTLQTALAAAGGE